MKWMTVVRYRQQSAYLRHVFLPVVLHHRYRVKIVERDQSEAHRLSLWEGGFYQQGHGGPTQRQQGVLPIPRPLLQKARSEEKQRDRQVSYAIPSAFR